MAEKIEKDDASWDEVQVTLIFTSLTSAVFLTIFLIARRNPAISAVFDRQRNSKPHRTPAPLLWNSFFKWLFLSIKPRYSEYADLSHMKDVIERRRRQRNPEKGAFFSSIKAGGSRDSSDYGNKKKKKKKKKTRQKSRNDSMDSSHGHADNFLQAIGDIAVQDNIFGVEVNMNSGSGRRYNRASSPSKKVKIQQYLMPDVVEINGRILPKEVAEYAMANDLTELQLKEYENALIDQEKQDEIEFHRRVNGMKAKYDKRNSLLGKNDANSGAGDEESPIVFDFNKEDKELFLLARANCLFYLNFQQGVLLTGPGNHKFFHTESQDAQSKIVVYQNF